MGNQTDYFNRIGYEPKYFIGDRVIGKWNKIPFVGTVGNDRLVSEITGPEITVHLDLPIMQDGTPRTVIIVRHRDVRLLPELEAKNEHSSRKTKEEQAPATRRKRSEASSKDSQATRPNRQRSSNKRTT